jgi:hypothetical protein
MEATVRLLIRGICGEKTRLRQDRVGRSSVPHTLRYDGIPFDPVLEEQCADHPRATPSCAFSPSAWSATRSWLHLMVGAARTVDQFAGVAEELVEVRV